MVAVLVLVPLFVFSLAALLLGAVVLLAAAAFSFQFCAGGSLARVHYKYHICCQQLGAASDSS